MDIRFIRNGETDQFKNMMKYCFGFTEENLCEYINEVLHIENIMGAFDNDKLIASLGVVPYNIIFESGTGKMGGIAAVSSLPESRNKGLVKNLLSESLEFMHEHGYMWSILGPFSYGFYRKYGWEIGFHKKRYSININSLKCFGASEYEYVPVKEHEFMKLHEIYLKTFGRYNGPVIRSIQQWKSRMKKQYIYGALRNNELTGYVAYNISNRNFNIVELGYTDTETKKELFKFVLKHDSQVDKVIWDAPADDNLLLLLEEPPRESSHVLKMMVRAVDVKAVLESIEFYDLSGCFKISVIDPWASWNNGTMTVEIREGKAHVSKTGSSDADVSCDINIFSQMAFGYVGFKEQYEASRIVVKNTDTIKLLSGLFPGKPTEINDFF